MADPCRVRAGCSSLRSDSRPASSSSISEEPPLGDSPACRGKARGEAEGEDQGEDERRKAGEGGWRGRGDPCRSARMSSSALLVDGGVTTNAAGLGEADPLKSRIRESSSAPESRVGLWLRAPAAASDPALKSAINASKPAIFLLLVLFLQGSFLMRIGFRASVDWRMENER